MSWIRNAVSRAVEAGAKNSLARSVRDYAEFIQDRIGPPNLRRFKQAVKRLEEVAVSCRGLERVQLLRRWLVALKEVERLSSDSKGKHEKSSIELLASDESKDSPTKPTSVYYVDPETDGGLGSFRNVFLHSQALEGITLSMVVSYRRKGSS